MKSSKDMSQDLVQGIESNLNKCVSVEVDLEKCYFETEGNCDSSALDQCTGKKIETKNTLYELANIGDFVNYDAGIWSSTSAMPTLDNILTFGGYIAGSSKNNSSTSKTTELLNGWRVLHKLVDSKKVVLIHAGITEYYSFKFDEAYNHSESHLFHNSQMILSGSGAPNGPLVGSYNSTYKDWDSIYGSDISSSYFITYQDIEFYKEQTGVSDYTTSDLINIGEIYLLDTYSLNSSNLICLEVINKLGKIECLNEGVVGIRPIVILNEGTLTSGSLTNSYGVKEWMI